MDMLGVNAGRRMEITVRWSCARSQVQPLPAVRRNRTEELKGVRLPLLKKEVQCCIRQ